MENNMLVKKAKNKDTEAIAELYKQNLGLIRTKCATFVSDLYPFEDLMQEAYFALLKAVEAYDEEDTPFAFTTYLGKAIEWHFCRYRKRDKNRRDICILDSPISKDDPEGTTRGELTEDKRMNFEEDILRDIDMSKVFDIVKAILNSKENDDCFDLLYRHCVLEQPYEYIAEITSKSTKDIKQAIEKAMRTLKHPRHQELQHLKKDYINTFRHISLTEFRHTNNSAVEWAVMKRNSNTTKSHQNHIKNTTKTQQKNGEKICCEICESLKETVNTSPL